MADFPTRESDCNNMLRPGCPGKTSWSELVGANGYAAALIIEKENRFVRAIVLLDGTPVTKDFSVGPLLDNGIVLSPLDQRTPATESEYNKMADFLCPPGKSSWPELVGANGFAAASIIEEENQHVRAIIVDYRAPATGDFRCDRVRVVVNKDAIVIRTPAVG
ncbi:hypothetical protein ACH5RR_020255 [Cinchona calisaya]|uniref:Uncharacterized protein n=1 Tax=Cinchona calisaya TaxID=153742 RepID=A0ABD2ZDZ1_9GENT